MKRRAHLLLALVLGSVAITACGTSSDVAVHRSLAALATAAPVLPASTPAPSVYCKPRILTASLHPPAAMPTPGDMPAGSFMAKIRHRGYLIAGVNAGDFGFGYLNPLTGKFEGFEIALVHELARAIFGNPNAVQLKALTVPERIPDVQNHSVDIVVDDVTITCLRRTQVDFSAVYYNDSQRVLVPASSHARGLKDLGGKRVCASAGSAPLLVIEHAQPHLTAVGLPQAIDCLVQLQEGRVDAISTDDSILLGFKHQDPTTKIVGPGLAGVPYGMAISRAHPDFVRFVNGVLARLWADRTWQALYCRWLGCHGPAPNPPTANYNG
jgi:polar amino acid transport system substrate-binding protein